MTLKNAPDLTQRPPRSPRVRLGGYAILPRMLDKGRATIAGKQGEYIYACPLDQRFLEFVGISADAASASLQPQVRAIVSGIADLLNMDPAALGRGTAIEVDDRFVGGGYGVPTDESREALELTARTEAIFLDPVYTGKAMSGLMAYVRQEKFTAKQTVVFWHTGGQVGLFT